MSGINNLKKRINYHGGQGQQSRMIADKLKSLESALASSYQAGTIKITDGRTFKGLMNPNQVTMDVDDKILSIPFKGLCLESNMKEDTNIQIGQTFEWKETKTHWIVYSQYLNEIAYFRGEVRKCEDEALEINGKRFYYCLKGPTEQEIDWEKSKHFIFNNLNYTLEIHISKTKETAELFHRFKKLKLPFKNSEGEIEFRPFEVQAIDDISLPGLITAYLKEDFNNKWAAPESVDPVIDESPIVGPIEVYPYDIVSYEIQGAQGGHWALSNKRAAIVSGVTENKVTVEIVTGKSGDFSLIYKQEGKEDIVKNISILSL